MTRHARVAGNACGIYRRSTGRDRPLNGIFRAVSKDGQGEGRKANWRGEQTWHAQLGDCKHLCREQSGRAHCQP